jgi:hypothetical protein
MKGLSSSMVLQQNTPAECNLAQSICCFFTFSLLQLTLELGVKLQCMKGNTWVTTHGNAVHGKAIHGGKAVHGQAV